MAINLAFMGTPEFVLPVLRIVEALAPAIDGNVVAVYSAPDRPAGRGRQMKPSPVSEYAASRGYAVFKPARLRNDEEKARFESLGVDLVVLAAYGLILPGAFLFEPKFGAVNVHPSLLPRHRGASPVAAAILAGDEVTGTTIMKMDEGLDTGPVLAQQVVDLAGNERAPELTDQLFRLGASMLHESLPEYIRGELIPVPQSEEGVSVVKRFSKEDGLLDWQEPAVNLERQVRAFDPWPGTATLWNGERLDIVRASVGRPSSGSPGEVVRSGKEVAVSTGDGSLVLERVRPAGRKEMDVASFVAGRPSFVGSVLPS